MNPLMGSISNGNGGGWSLEVVRGKDAGRIFALSTGEVVLGNAPGDRGGIDLATQEGEGSRRRMAARHASLECSTGGLAVRDLESPGGTFVNRQRILPGQARPLQPGDVIQLGGVQLKVVDGKPPVARPQVASNSGSFSYVIPGGPTCRNWDDVLIASAQRWESLRSELVSGRLAAFLVSIGRGDLAPSPKTPGSPDERLDAWLGSLPTTKEARPELDVHPARLAIRATPGGGSTRRSVQVSNVGHRLLRSTARIEPAGVPWLALPTEFDGRPFVAIEGVEIPVEVTIPETLPRPLTAELVIEGNGGSKRVVVVLEAKSTRAEFPADAGSEPDRSSVGGPTIGELIVRQRPVARVATWGMAALAIRLVIGVASGSIGEDAMTASGPDSPRLGGVALLLAVVGALIGGTLAVRRGGARDVPTGAFAGGFAGVIAASSLVATCRSVEPMLGSWSTSVIAVCLLWALIGSGLAALSTLVAKGTP